jgi:FMN phosphatase YigB (HAD superfamily)
MQKEKIILTDIDGVWLDWEQGFTDYLEKYYKIKRVDTSKYTAHLRWQGDEEQLRQLTWHFNMSSWTRYLKPFRDAQTVVPKLAQEGWKFIGITSMHEDQYSHRLREQNLKDLFGDVFEKVIVLHTGQDKDEALLPWKDSGYYWIEDKIKNVKLGVQMGLNTIMIRHEYNASYDNPKVTKVDNWQQIHYYINKR